MKKETYLHLKSQLIEEGYADEIQWQTELEPCMSAIQFRNEAIWVILNSGMREQIARIIKDKIFMAIANGKDISTAFGHKGKVAAIKHILSSYNRLFSEYMQSDDKIEYLQSIPFIGGITKYHLAKNLGHDCIKPDRHLVRIAGKFNMNCNDMCEQLSKETGDKVSVVDIVLWRSANLGWI